MHNAMSRSIVKNFLTSAVMIDDDISSRSNEEADGVALAAIDEPSLDALPDVEAVDVPPVVLDTSVPISDDSAAPLPRPLLGDVLVKAFSAENIICSVYAWDEFSDQAIPEYTNKADLIILDWKLNGKEKGKFTSDYIIKQFKRDAEHGERLRFITVYSSEKIPEIVSELSAKLTSDGNITFDVQADYIDILNVNNHLTGRIQVVSKDCPEEELAKHLIDKFRDFTEGFLPTFSLAAVSQIREATYSFLAEYNKSLDAAVLSHFLELRSKALSFPLAETLTKDYIINLFSDTVKTTLNSSKIIDGLVSNKILSSFMSKSKKILFNNKLCNFVSDGQLTDILSQPTHPEMVAKLITSQPSFGDAQETSFLNAKSQKDKLCDYSPDDENTKLELSCIEVHSVYNPRKLDRPPALKLGTIVSNVATGDFFVCVQPLCDSLRLDPANSVSFPFLPLSEDATSYSIVAYNGGAFKKLKCSTRPKNLSIQYFKCDRATLDVRSVEFSGDYKFTTSDNQPRVFKWEGELKNVIAQGILHSLASEGSRVGTDTFEWLRFKFKQ